MDTQRPHFSREVDGDNARWEERGSCARKSQPQTVLRTFGVLLFEVFTPIPTSKHSRDAVKCTSKEFLRRNSQLEEINGRITSIENDKIVRQQADVRTNA